MLVLWNPTGMMRTYILIATMALGGCAGNYAPHGAQPSSTAAHARSASDTAQAAETASGLPGETASGLPGETASGLPGETASGLPGETASGLPGETASGLPGGSFTCPGLPNSGSASCTMIVNSSVPPVALPGQSAALIAGLHPADLQSAYGFDPMLPGGTVAIVDAYDNPTAESDLAIYRAAFGLPPCTTQNGCFRKVNQRGQTASYPPADTGWAQESSLDIEMVSAACPRCAIVLVEADSALMDDLGAAVDTAVTFRPSAVSNSYYAPEWANESVEEPHYRHAGVAITASSGDRGYASYPAASPNVTSVGGTSLSRGNGGWTESAWQYTGHGCSKYLARPWFQQRLGCTKRSAVDVAAVADPQTGVATYSSTGGGWFVAGGTSVGVPLIASGYALSGRPSGPSYAYTHWQDFRQIGGSGYSRVTGIGSPNGLSGL